jgi:hypothetical protein
MFEGVSRNWRFILTLLAPVLLTAIPIFWKGETGKVIYKISSIP